MNDFWITNEEYGFVTSKTTIPTVDLVILRGKKRSRRNILETLLLKRKTGYEKNKWCIIGGRQYLGEVAEQTIARQASDLGIEVKVLDPFELNFPAWINDNPDQDRTKHPTSMIYPVKIISGEIREEGEEYKGFKWFNVDDLPNIMAYDHKFQIQKVVEQLKRFHN